jgi:hypothetical protein
VLLCCDVKVSYRAKRMATNIIFVPNTQTVWPVGGLVLMGTAAVRRSAICRFRTQRDMKRIHGQLHLLNRECSNATQVT